MIGTICKTMHYLWAIISGLTSPAPERWTGHMTASTGGNSEPSRPNSESVAFVTSQLDVLCFIEHFFDFVARIKISCGE